MIHYFLKRAKARLVNFVYGLRAKTWPYKKVRHGDACFKLSCSTSHEVYRAVTFASKEPETLNWIDGFDLECGSPPVFFDIGANVGVYSLYACAKHPNLTVHAFEPESQSFAALCKNIYLNGMTIKPFMLALSDIDKLGVLEVSILKAGAGAASIDGPYKFVKASLQRETFKQGVTVARVDSLVLDARALRPTYVKIDVDGPELEVLRGGEEVFGSDQCKGVLVEYGYKDQDEKNTLIDLMKSYGFFSHEESEWSDAFGQKTIRNFIFTK